MTIEAHSSYLHNSIKKKPRIIPPESTEIISMTRHEWYKRYSLVILNIITDQQVLIKTVEIVEGIPYTTDCRLLTEEEINENGGIVGNGTLPTEEVRYNFKADSKK